jgi:type II secretion system protein I
MTMMAQAPFPSLALTRSKTGHRHSLMPKVRHGLSLIEVILALAILGVALTAIGELMRIGSRNAESARDLTTAQILCETKMAELVTGLIPATTTPPAPMVEIGSGNDWLYAVESQPIGQQGLLSVRVIVQQNPELVSRPASFMLTRWITDPNSLITTDPTGSTVTGGTSGLE